jgi:hypothetical protein
VDTVYTEKFPVRLSSRTESPGQVSNFLFGLIPTFSPEMELLLHMKLFREISKFQSGQLVSQFKALLNIWRHLTVTFSAEQECLKLTTNLQNICSPSQGKIHIKITQNIAEHLTILQAPSMHHFFFLKN